MTLDPQHPAPGATPNPGGNPALPPPTGAARPGPPPVGASPPPPSTPLPPPDAATIRPAAPLPPPTPPRRRTGLILGLAGGGAALLILIIVIAGAVASQLDRQNALTRYGSAEDALVIALERSETDVAEADEVLALAADPFLPPSELGTVQERRTDAAALVADAETLLGVDESRLATDDVRRATGDLQRLATDLTRTDLAATLRALLATTQSGAAGLEATYFDGENAPRIAFRTASDGLVTASGTQVGESLAAYLAAAAALAASHDEELAEKAGPLFDARMAVQDFARSMSGGVMLEFDWAPTVNGYGTGGSYGGTSYWTTADGGQATVTLSDSVAALWPGAGVQALVVHEVGHAVLARRDCNVLFFESDLYAGEEESWATAWAIGLGYTADGSGESIYGRPSDALIALAQQCR